MILELGGTMLKVKFLVVILGSALSVVASDHDNCLFKQTVINGSALEYLDKSRELEEPVVRAVKISNGSWTDQDEVNYQRAIKGLLFTKSLLVGKSWKSRLKSWFSYSETADPLTWKP